MQTIMFNRFGDVDVLSPGTIDNPRTGPGEVRIRIIAAGVNPVDAKIRRGLLQGRLPHEMPIIPGWDAAGVIDEVGEGVEDWSAGDEVFAYCRKPVIQFGCYAEYVVVPASFIAAKPARASFNEAASIPLAALTAWQSLYDAANLQAGQTVLVHAGAGGVGGFAIQLAKLRGAHVITTASAVNHPYVHGLGADEVIDYTTMDFREAVRAVHPDGVDVVYDTVGGEVQLKSAEVIKPGGTMVSILAYADEAAIQAKGIHTHYVFVSPNNDQLAELAQLYDEQKLSTRIAAEFPLSEAAEAHRRIESGHTAGKMVLRIS
ncbi:MAG: NADP-dependent oxidoreductase [Kiritimatiellia bacterium]